MKEKKETIEEYIARGGKIEIIVNENEKIPKKYTKQARRNKDYSVYDYSDSDYPTPMSY